MNALRLARCLSPLGLCVLGVLATPAQAQTPPDPKALYSKGMAELERDDFAQALEHLRASYSLLPSPNTLLLIAHAERRSGNKTAAMRDYQKVVQEAGARVQHGDSKYTEALQNALQWTEALSQELSQLSVLVENPPEGAVVRIRGQVVQTTRTRRGALASEPTWWEPGDLAVEVEAPGTRRSKKGILLKGEKETWLVDFAVEDAPVRTSASARPAPPPPTTAQTPLGTWIAAGVGVAGVGTFAVFGLLARSRHLDLQDCSPECDESRRDTGDQGKTYQTIANTGLVVGGLGLATALGFFLLTPTRGRNAAPRTTSLSLGVGPTGASLVGRY